MGRVEQVPVRSMEEYSLLRLQPMLVGIIDSITISVISMIHLNVLLYRDVENARSTLV
jgi:hypothetical protein